MGMQIASQAQESERHTMVLIAYQETKPEVNAQQVTRLQQLEGRELTQRPGAGQAQGPRRAQGAGWCPPGCGRRA